MSLQTRRNTGKIKLKKVEKKQNIFISNPPASILIDLLYRFYCTSKEQKCGGFNNQQNDEMYLFSFKFVYNFFFGLSFMSIYVCIFFSCFHIILFVIGI